jgi:2-polyprenyl-3-methyl-5-hydroxy-6-metoxy-1,4-benzoquinol methylase
MSAATIGLDKYHYQSSEAPFTHEYLLGPLLGLLRGTGEHRIIEIGAGNGALAAILARNGYDVTAIEPSSEGVTIARAAHPSLKVHQGDAYEPLAARFGTFPIVLSVEVVEHVYSPKRFAATCAALLEPGGTLILTTPFHGYWKNLALALTGKMDAHFTALWEGGHIKFWSERTLRQLLTGAGLADIKFLAAGRIPPLAKSMIAVARKGF